MLSFVLYPSFKAHYAILLTWPIGSGEESLQPHGLNLIRQLLKGLLHFCSDNEDAIKHVSTARHVLNGSWSAQHENKLLWGTFKSVLDTLINTTILIVIDSLDKFSQEDKEGFRGNLLSLPPRSPSISREFRVLVASRSAHGIDRHQDDRSTILLDTNEIQVNHDIGLYVRSSLRKFPKLIGLSLQSMEDLAAEIQNTSHGIFLWASHTIRDIEEEVVSLQIPYQLKNIPTGMIHVLSDLTACLEFEQPGYLIACIIVASEDNIGPQDIRLMLEIGSWNDTLLSRIGLHEPIEECIQDACGPVVICRDGVVRFYHPIVRDYLLSTQKLNLETCHAILAAGCLKYASLEQYHANHNADTMSAHERFQTLCNAQPFLKYAVKYWSYHFLGGTRSQTGGFGKIAVQRLIEADGIAWMESSFAASESRDSRSEEYKGRNMETRMAFKGDSDLETITSMIEVALDAQGRGNVVKSQLLLEQVGATAVFNGLSFTIRYQVLSGLSRSYERQNRWQDAEEKYRRCLDECRSAGRRAEVCNIQTQNNLAWVLKAQGRLFEAVEQYENAYAEGTELLDPEHQELRLTADGLCGTYESVGRTREAKKILLSQLYAYQRMPGSSHPSTIEKAQAVMDFHSKHGQTKEAENLFRKLFAESGVQGMPDFSIGQTLSRALEDRGDLVEAEAILASIMRAQLERSEPVDFAAVVRISSVFAQFHMRHRDWTAAIGVLESCMNRNGHLARQGASNEFALLVARCKEELGRIEEAQAEYENLFSSEVEGPGWTCRTTMELGHGVAAFYDRHGHGDKALEKYMQVQEGIAHTLGPAHRYNVDAGKTLAAFYERRKNWHAAGRLYDDVQRQLMATRGGKHRTTRETWTSNQITRLHRIEV